MTDTPLKRCPFCNGEAHILEKIHLTPPGFSPECINEKCLVHPLAREYQTKEDAIAAWNTRHIPAITDEDVERAMVAHAAFTKGPPVMPSPFYVPPNTTAVRAALTAHREGRG